MAAVTGVRLSRRFKIPNLKFSTSCFANNKWRIKQGLEANPTRFGPLTNLPDYSFVDGRPTLLSHFKKEKILHQQQLCRKIAELSHEIDVGMEEYYKKLERQKQEREAILQNKLKPKGAAPLSKNKCSSSS